MTTAAAAGGAPTRARRTLPTWILVASLIVLPLFPFVVFIPHVVRERPSIVEHGRRSPSLRESMSQLAAARQSIKERRAARHLTAGDAIVGLSVPLVWIALFAVVGRRGFALRV